MKNAYLRNLVISSAVHTAFVCVLIAFSLGSCHSRRPLKDMAVFVEFRPGPPAPPAIAPPAPPELPLPQPADIPEPIPEPAKPKTVPEKTRKPKIEVNTNLVRRAAAPTARPAIKKLSAEQIRRMLENAAALPGAPQSSPGSGSGSGAVTPYGWYLSQVRAVMYDAWQQPSALAGKRGLVTRVLIRVRRDGLITRKQLTASSGNSLMDASVMTAVESVASLPELPFGFGGADKDITIDFELEEQ